MKELRTIISHYDRWLADGKQMALATVVDTEASSYRRIGARMLVAEDGQWIGGISGGCLEGDALRRAREAIINGRPFIRTYDTREGDDVVIGVGLGCQGRIDVLISPLNAAEPDNAIETLRGISETRESLVLFTLLEGAEKASVGKPQLSIEVFSGTNKVAKEVLAAEAAEVVKQAKSRVTAYGDQRILLEYIAPEIRVIAVGDNYDVLALGHQCKALGWQLHLVGILRKFTKTHFSLATSLHQHSALKTLALDEYTMVVLMSHDYQRDLDALRELVKLKPRYLGLLGPVKRKEKLLAELGAGEVDFLYGPVGLDIGATGPEEIALSITADMLRVLRNRPGGELRKLTGSIHER